MITSQQARGCFLEQYRQVRHAEGRGSEDPAYYRALPYQDLTGKNTAMWAMRARTYRYFERKVLPRLEREAHHPLDVLDLGAGNGWMSYRLALRKHCPVALDIFNDPLDGLRAVNCYPMEIPAVEADFNALPFGQDAFDLMIFNASVHYSSNYAETLSEVRRCLRRSGHFVILDSPVYRLPEHGLRMIEERKAAYRERYGFASDALRSIEFLDEVTLEQLARKLGIRWQVYRPWYGWSWHARPLVARLRVRRPPSRFWILVGAFAA
jgi:SAM-dependent methyltransferase